MGDQGDFGLNGNKGIFGEKGNKGFESSKGEKGSKNYFLNSFQTFKYLK